MGTELAVMRLVAHAIWYLGLVQSQDQSNSYSNWELVEPDLRYSSCDTVWDKECLIKCRAHQGTCNQASLYEIANGIDIVTENCHQKCKKVKKVHSNVTSELHENFQQ